MQRIPFALVVTIALSCALGDTDVGSLRAALTPPFAGIPADTIVPSQEVGALPMAVTSTDTGALIAEIPIVVPPARRGMQPELSLAYDSDSHVGLAGMGWTIRGLSAIDRCARTVAIDGPGNAEEVRLDGSDAFCLDGQRLIGIAGSYGEPGAVYRTETDDFSRISSHGDPSDAFLGPTRFERELPNGQTLTYAAVLAARPVFGTDRTGQLPLAVRQDAIRFRWALSQVRDGYGNTIHFDYSQSVDPLDDQAVEFLPSRITYTGRVGSPDRGNREVRFSFKAGSDRVDRFVAGVHLRQTRRLDRIDLLAPDESGAAALVGTYRLTYRNDSITGRSLLSAVTLCDAADACLPATTIDWSLGDFDVDTVTTGLGAPNAVGLADVNGDGRDDLLYQPPQPTPPMVGRMEWLRRLSDGSTFGGDELTAMFSAPTQVDYDGDGQTELLAASPTPESFSRHLLRFADRTVPFVTVQAFGPEDPADRNAIYLADYNQDGATDILRRDSDPVWNLGLRQPASDPPFASYIPAFADPRPASEDDERVYKAMVYVTDLDGDAAPEVLIPLKSERRYVAFDPAGHGVAAAVPNFEWKWNDYRFMDVNGDGLRDLVDLGIHLSTALRVRINTGRGFGPWYAASTSTYFAPWGPLDPRPEVEEPIPPSPDRFTWFLGDQRVRLLDYNVDGLTDILVLGPEPRVYLSNGRTFRGQPLSFPYSETPPPAATGGECAPGERCDFAPFEVADVDGDGIPDFVQGDPIAIRRRTGSCPDRVRSIRDGRGLIFSAEYSTLTNSAVYRETTRPAHPSRTVDRGRRVVSRLTRVVGGQTLTRTFRYEDGRVDTHGRGFLGFTRVVIHEPEVGRWSERLYNLAAHMGSEYYATRGTPTSHASFTVEPDGLVHGTTTSVTYEVVRVFGGNVYRPRPIRRDTRLYEYRPTRETPAPNPDREIGAQLPTAATLQREATRHEDHDPVCGQPRFVEEGRDGGSRSMTRVNFENREGSSWILCLAERVAVENVFEGQRATRTMSFKYDHAGSVQTATREPDAPTPDPEHLKLVTSYGRDAMGLVQSVGSFDTEGNSRGGSFTYELDGAFVRSHTNGLGHTTWFGHHAGLGVLAISADPNGVVSTFQYDGFGRVRGYADPRTARTTVDYETLADLVAQRTRTAAGSEQLDLFDEAARPIAQRVRTASGDWSETGTAYDPLGRIREAGLPHFLSDAPVSIELEYDAWNRPLRVTPSTPGRGARTFEYSGRNVLETDPRGFDRTLWLRRRWESSAHGRAAHVAHARLSTLRLAWRPDRRGWKHHGVRAGSVGSHPSSRRSGRGRAALRVQRLRRDRERNESGRNGALRPRSPRPCDGASGCERCRRVPLGRSGARHRYGGLRHQC